jgi:integrase
VARAELAPVIPLRAPVSGEDELSRLRRAVDLPRLIEVGYDPHAHIIRPHAEHPVFGFELCPVVHCTAAVERHALCEACWRRFQGFEGTFEEFAALPRARIHGPAQQPLCLVCRTAGHERPAWRCKGLCRSCDAQRKARGQTVAEYVAGAQPRPSFGGCGRCGHLAAFRAPRLCEPCHRRWVAGGKPDLSEFARTRLRGDREPTREVDLSALGERVRLEILYAFQELWLDGGYAWVSIRHLQGAVDLVARAGVTSLLDELWMSSRDSRCQFCRQLRVPVERLLGDPERELSMDVWRMGILRPDGGRQRIDYGAITQPWLREAAKQWNLQRLVSRNVDRLRETVHVAAALSAVLRLRGDRGDEPGGLGRQDAVDFLTHLGTRELAGELTNSRHRELVCGVRALLRETRDRGLHRQAGQLEGLADEFAFYDADVPRVRVRDPEGEPERALPQVVIDQLLAPEAIALLRETAGEALACSIELQMRTGRRPQEIAHAPFNCLEHEQRVREDGKLEYLPVFVYRPEKRPKTRKELPIFTEESRLIKRMQSLARERFPDADPGRLPLVPRLLANRDGRQPIRPTMLPTKMRQWTRALGELTGPDGEPFDRTKVFPYAFRHSYAQRLADEGATESELMDLMDHDSFDTTRGYFRIRAERRRRAADLGRKALFDNQGRRLMRGLEHLAEAERARMQLGSLAVPYGACVEPVVCV